eukprot:scaffold181408_cov39-Tisochrysis_lutea.AAC.1
MVYHSDRIVFECDSAQTLLQGHSKRRRSARRYQRVRKCHLHPPRGTWQTAEWLQPQRAQSRKQNRSWPPWTCAVAWRLSQHRQMWSAPVVRLWP